MSSVDELTSQLEKLEVGHKRELCVPKAVWERLLPHQRKGVEWLWRRYRDGGGALLADDMGLGKTVQVAAFLGAVKPRKSLIIAPKSLLHQWGEHCREWGGIEATILHGDSPSAREGRLKSLAKCGGTAITSYGVVTSSLELLAGVEWDVVVLDEAHKVKNPATEISRALRTLRATARIALTGTVVQNNLTELWSVVDWVTKGDVLGSQATFKTKFADPILRSRCRDASAAERAEGEALTTQLQELVAPVVCRREKESVLDVGGAKPGKLTISVKRDVVVWLRLTKLQEDAYKDTLVRAAGGHGAKGGMLKTVAELRKVCQHMWMTAPGSEVERARELLGDARPLPEDFDKSYGGLVTGNCKLAFLSALLKELAVTKRRSLVFSQSTRMLDLVGMFLDTAGYRYLRIDGSLSSKSRYEVVDAFNRDESVPVCLLTTQVGGVGLNLTGASCVVILDAAWNPATDSQAVDRAYRIGQLRDVTVYRLVTCGTVEERAYRLQVFKHTLAQRTMATTSSGDGDDVARYFTLEQLRKLLKEGDLTRCETAERLLAAHAKLSEDVETSCLRAKLRCTSGVLQVTNHALLTSRKPQQQQQRDDLDALCNSMSTLTVRSTPGMQEAVRSETRDSDSSSDSESGSDTSDSTSTSTSTSASTASGTVEPSAVQEEKQEGRGASPPAGGAESKTETDSDNPLYGKKWMDRFKPILLSDSYKALKTEEKRDFLTHLSRSHAATRRGEAEVELLAALEIYKDALVADCLDALRGARFI